MKQEEIQKKSQEKIQAIQILCKQLQVTLTAEQVVNERGMIKNLVYFIDTEKYEVDKEETKDSISEEMKSKTNEKITNLRE